MTRHKLVPYDGRMDWNTTLARLRADQENWPRVAAETGLSLWHVRRLASGATLHPRIDTAAKIVAYYERDTGDQVAA